MTQAIPTDFQFIQATPAQTWVIVHNLNRYPIVDSYVSVNGVNTRIVPASVIYTDANTCTLQFAIARAGFATVI